MSHILTNLQLNENHFDFIDYTTERSNVHAFIDDEAPNNGYRNRSVVKIIDD